MIEYSGARQHTLNSVKYGQMTALAGELVGSYTKSKFDIQIDEDLYFGMDTIVARFMTHILEGKTYAEDFEVLTDVPATWWQHFKLAVSEALPASIIGSLVAKSVRNKTLRSTVKLEGKYLYPQADFLTEAAGPVTITETATLPDWPETPDHYLPAFAPSRFANEGEIANAFYSDPTYATMGPPTPHMILHWLARHGVNTNQLVPRKRLQS